MRAKQTNTFLLFLAVILITNSCGSPATKKPKTGKFDAYVAFMNKKFVSPDGRSVEIILEFLPHEEEARLEHKSLYGASYRASNTTNVEAVLDASKGETFGNTLIMSIGSSSTQIYHEKGVVGYFNFGTTRFADASTISELVDRLQRSVTDHNIKAIVMMGSIGYLLKNSRTHINALEESEINNHVKDENGSRNFLRAFGTELKRRIPNVSLYLKDRHDRSKNIKLSWIKSMTEEIQSRIGHEQHGYYLVDFGGGGIEISCLRCGTKAWSETDRFLKDHKDSSGKKGDIQQDFVKAVTTLEDPSTDWIVQMAKDHITKLALEHAKAQGFMRPIHVYVYQTGLLREEHAKSK